MIWKTDLERVSASAAARIVVETHLAATAAALEALIGREHADALHDVRVAMRRLVSALGAFHKLLHLPKRLRRKLRRLARATNQARDLQVELSWLQGLSEGASTSLTDALHRLRRSSRQESKRAAATLAEQLPKLLARVEAALRVPVHSDSWAPSFGCVSAGLARVEIARLARRLEAGPLDDEALHRVRLDAKRLRYLLEPVAAATPETKRLVQRLSTLQSVLGRLRDRQAFCLRARRQREEGLDLEATRWLEAQAQAELAAAKCELLQGWLGEDGAAGALLSQTERVAAQLESASDAEVERKYLLRSLPSTARLEASSEILQGFIPGERIHERLRRIEARDGSVCHRRTLKLGRGLSRVEIEEEVSAELFERMWPLTSGHRVHKRRYLVERQGLTWELDEFLDRELYLAEVELPSPRVRPPMPAWLASCVVRDVTGESGYVNLLLAR